MNWIYKYFKQYLKANKMSNMSCLMNIAPTFKALRAKPVKQVLKQKCAKTVPVTVKKGTKNREKGIRYVEVKEPAPINAVQMVQQACEKRNLVEICMRKARMMAQRKADRNTKEFYNMF